jgi:hypothetical protein
MKPIVLFGLQFSLALVGYALLAWWYVEPRLARLPRELALVPLVWVHVFRFVGGTVLAPGSVGNGVHLAFQRMVGIGDLVTSGLALLAVIALRSRPSRALPLVWLMVIVGGLDTVNAVIQSLRDNVFVHSLGFNWVVVTSYVPALVVSSVLIVIHLVRPGARQPIVSSPG